MVTAILMIIRRRKMIETVINLLIGLGIVFFGIIPWLLGMTVIALAIGKVLDRAWKETNIDEK